MLGIIQHTSPLTQVLNLNEKVELKINISHDLYISRYYTNLSVAWYHNNTRITTNERINIADGGTTLTIADTVETDAGKYQVRIDSMNFSSGVDPPECPKNILPLFEDLALHAPVTFLLQQSVTPVYNPEDIIINYTIPDYLGEDQHSLLIDTTSRINTSYISANSLYIQLYKNAVYINSGNYNYTKIFNENRIGAILEFKYNNSGNIIGLYVLHEYWYLDTFNCPIYRNYYRHYLTRLYYEYLRITYFSIILRGESICLYHVVPLTLHLPTILASNTTSVFAIVFIYVQYSLY